MPTWRVKTLASFQAGPEYRDGNKREVPTAGAWIRNYRRR